MRCIIINAVENLESQDLFQQIPHFEEAHQDYNPGRQLQQIRDAVPGFKKWFKETGKASAFHSFDLIKIPYPKKYGLWRAGRSPVPFIWFTNRMFIVQWEAQGRTWTLLNEPSETELDEGTPFYSALIEKYGKFSQKLLPKTYGTVEDYLEDAGLKPEDVDYITYDHLHTQDVRRWLGTIKPQADLSPNEPLEPYFPNAKLIVQQKEWDILPRLHPLQEIWQPETYEDIPLDSLLFTNGDLLLGPGVALMYTPGHTQGNHSLVVNTDTGIWVSSENAIAAECLVPEESGIPGLKQYAKHTRFDVVINGNTLENTSRQYNSVVQEKLMADLSRKNPKFPQFFPSSELTPSIFAIGTKPSFMHKKVAFGTIQRPKSDQT
ncbi:hypothetical protein [Lentibacillus salicampi]|uniref:MBL fold metallo-hydrolase n=1 Tax=Lentibacillus salicampi TaxID=175306 RepID=A0A4Y9AH33_9BACI|nr:hypothetical protein [Lentibacillus salicampi]TFJ94270.1 hypothetical protein E4U82_03165 [Lentibacillus salicampi]